MDCKTARLVWNHPGGVIEGIREHLPGALEELTAQARKFVVGTPDTFDSEVKRKSGVCGNFRLEHSDGESALARSIHDIVGDVTARIALERHFSQMFDSRIVIGNICCSSHQFSDGGLSDEEQLRIQLAAVNTEPV